MLVLLFLILFITNLVFVVKIHKLLSLIVKAISDPFYGESVNDDENY